MHVLIPVRGHVGNDLASKGNCSLVSRAVQVAGCTVDLAALGKPYCLRKRVVSSNNNSSHRAYLLATHISHDSPALFSTAARLCVFHGIAVRLYHLDMATMCHFLPFDCTENA